MLICNKDCANCALPDCCNDSMDAQDYQESAKREKAMFPPKTKAKYLSHKREYYVANRETMLPKMRKYYYDNRERLNEQHKRYNADNKEQIAAYKKEWREKNRERLAVKDHERYVRRKEEIKKWNEKNTCNYAKNAL